MRELTLYLGMSLQVVFQAVRYDVGLRKEFDMRGQVLLDLVFE